VSPTASPTPTASPSATASPSSPSASPRNTAHHVTRKRMEKQETPRGD
jgi:hypothetical protein